MHTFNPSDLVLEFHLKYGHYRHIGKGFPDDDVIDFRRRLIKEEAREFADECYLIKGARRINPEKLALNEIYHKAALAKELADLEYVIHGAAITFDIPLDKVFREVHSSNMTKSTKKDRYGKTVKGDDYRAPDIVSILKSYYGVLND